MRTAILDTNVLIRHWHKSKQRPLEQTGVDDVIAWAARLVELADTRAIVTPVAMEFLCGVVSRREMELARAFLGEFTIVDEGRITADDWARARRHAERIPREPTPRDLGDCLIRAIADRLRYDVDTFDEGMPRARSEKKRSERARRRRR